LIGEISELVNLKPGLELYKSVGNHVESDDEEDG
jgi:hypothetical protein